MNTYVKYYIAKCGDRSGEARFTTKYATFLNYVKRFARQRNVLEVGCGTGLVSRIIKPYAKSIRLTDKSTEMLSLTRRCIKESKKVKIYPLDILHEQKLHVDVVYSHGLLEHFTPRTLLKVQNNLSKIGRINIHYVPTNKYTTKAIGNEYLRSREWWIKKLRPRKTIVSNKGRDLILIW